MSLSDRLINNKKLMDWMDNANYGDPIGIFIFMIIMLIISIELLLGVITCVPEMPKRGV